MYALALHTSSAQLGLSLSNFVNETRSQTWDLNRELSTYLHLYLRDFIKPQTWQDLDFLTVAKGPGSFTSTRMGVVTARTLAQQLEIPLFSGSTLAALAWSKKAEFTNILMALQMEATRGQLYGGIYEVQQEQLIIHFPDTLMTPEAWQNQLATLRKDYQLIQASEELGNTATSLLELAYQEWQQGKRPHWSEILPFYGS